MVNTPLPTNCLSVFDHFVRLALKGLTIKYFTVFVKISVEEQFFFSSVLIASKVYLLVLKKLEF